MLYHTTIKLRPIALSLAACFLMQCTKEDRVFPELNFVTEVLPKVAQRGNILYVIDKEDVWAYDANDPKTKLGKLATEKISWRGITATKDYLVLYQETGRGFLFKWQDSLKVLGVPNFYLNYDDEFAFVRDVVYFASGKDNVSNNLNIFDIAKKKLNRFNLTRPSGLAISDTVLYVLNGSSDLSLYGISDSLNPVFLKTISDISATKASLNNDVLILYGTSLLYQYNCKDPLNPKLISKTPL